MGSASQFIAYINADTAPGDGEKLTRYTHIEITEELKKVRRNYRQAIKKDGEPDRRETEGQQCLGL